MNEGDQVRLLMMESDDENLHIDLEDDGPPQENPRHLGTQKQNSNLLKKFK